MLSSIREHAAVKICGLTHPDDCRAVNKAAADYAGFILTSSRRQVSPESARQLISLLNPEIKAVGVFTDESPDDIIKVSLQLALPVIQLHGSFSNNKYLLLKNNLPQQTLIWRRLAVPLNQSEQTSAAVIAEQLRDAKNHFADPDAWLLDSSLPGQAGGTGRSFDWTSLKTQIFTVPLVLAGGLEINNVCQAIKLLRPDIVDCSSGVETNGRKDFEKIIEFCRAVRSCGLIHYGMDNQ